ncbi:MAG: HAD hydrolase-like protein [Propionicimonas sp.]|uniref:HAD family hydrolase n=1 Tax=Propionicimonas sp. TaxID=1955623 RepID=UPI003D1301D0
MATHVVWDWNGTLLDDLECCVSVTNRMLAEFGLPELVDVAAYQSVFRFPIIEYYADLGFDTAPGGNFDAAARRYLQLYSPAARACGLHAGARETLRTLHAAGIGQVIVSASEQTNLRTQLEPFGLDAWLDGAHGIEDIYAASKRAVAERWLHTASLDPADVLFVGDSEHDFDIADALGSTCVLYSGGHHARTHLAGLGVPVIDDLAEVTRFVAVR